VSGQDPLAVRASKNVRGESQMVSQYASSLLKGDLDNVPLWRGNHVAVTQIAEDYAKYLYLQRVRGPEVVLSSIRGGLGLMMWATETFGYAESWDEDKGRYVGLQGGRMINITGDSTGLLIKSDIATKQLEAERSTIGAPSPQLGATSPSTGGTQSQIGGTSGIDRTAPPQPQLKRFHATVHIDPSRIGRDAGRIAEEVVQHLALLPDASVEVVLEIQAEIPDGAPENVVRTVTENWADAEVQESRFRDRVSEPDPADGWQLALVSKCNDFTRHSTEISARSPMPGSLKAGRAQRLLLQRYNNPIKIRKKSAA